MGKLGPTDLPEHLDPSALRASASLQDWRTVRNLLHTAGPSTLRSVVIALLASEPRYDWVGAELATRPAPPVVQP